MKKSSISLLIVVFIAGNFLSGSNSHLVDVKPEFKAVKIEKKESKNLNEEIATAHKSLNSDFEKFIVETNTKISRNELDISKLSAQVNNRFETNNEILLTVDGIGKRNIALKGKLDNYVSTGSGNWKIFKSEFNRDLDELAIAYNDVARNIIM